MKKLLPLEKGLCRCHAKGSIGEQALSYHYMAGGSPEQNWLLLPDEVQQIQYIQLPPKLWNGRLCGVSKAQDSSFTALSFSSLSYNDSSSRGWLPENYLKIW